MSLATSIPRVCFVLFFSLLLPAQQREPNKPAQTSSPSVAQQSWPAADDSFAQIRDDLNKMESLNMNMSSEIEFLHDQNLQILLRTNSQMWTILIRDLRRQLAEQQHRSVVPPPESR